MRIRRRVAGLATLGSLLVAAQTIGHPAIAPVQAQVEAQKETPKGSDPYVYQPAGRRDPFVSLLGTGAEPRATSKRGDGPAGMLVNEIAVRAVIQSGKVLIAMVQGPDGKSHIIHTGDAFMDGVVKAITLQGLLIEQEVHDPLSLEKRREVRKLLRSAEDGKP